MPSCDACSIYNCNPLDKIQGSAHKTISEIIKLVEELQKENNILKKNNADLIEKIDKLQVNKNEIIEEIVSSLKK